MVTSIPRSPPVVTRFEGQHASPQRALSTSGFRRLVPEAAFTTNATTKNFTVVEQIKRKVDAGESTQA